MSKSEATPTNTGKAGEPALTDKELDAVTGGGTVNHSEFQIVKLIDAATPIIVRPPMIAGAGVEPNP